MTFFSMIRQHFNQAINPLACIYAQIFLIAFITILLFIRPVYLKAKDFGVVGHTYEIIEEDILKVIERQLAQVDQQKLNEEMRKTVQVYAEKPTPVKGITKAKEKKVSYYDPSYVLNHDVKDHNGLVIHKAGTIVNPLEYVPLREALIFIDGDDEKQVKRALEKKEKRRVKIILLKGSPLKLQKEYKTWIYFDQAGVLTTKLGIKESPALVEQEGLKLKITTGGE